MLMNNQFASNIAKYFVYTALKGFSFGLIAAMWVIFLTSKVALLFETYGKIFHIAYFFIE